MNKPGHDDVEMLPTLIHHRQQQTLQLHSNILQSGPHPQFRVGGDLIVSRAASVQFAGDVLADDFSETSLVGGVNVLVGRENHEVAFAPFVGHRVQPAMDSL